MPGSGGDGDGGRPQSLSDILADELLALRGEARSSAKPYTVERRDAVHREGEGVCPALGACAGREIFLHDRVQEPCPFVE